GAPLSFATAGSSVELQGKPGRHLSLIRTSTLRSGGSENGRKCEEKRLTNDSLRAAGVGRAQWRQADRCLDQLDDTGKLPAALGCNRNQNRFDCARPRQAIQEVHALDARDGAKRRGAGVL